MKSNVLFALGLPVFFVFLPALALSQDILWEKSYGGLHAEYLLDAVPTADYGFILAGSSVSGKTGNKKQDNVGDLDYWVWKMDETGALDWQKSFGGTGSDILRSVRNTRDGGFILAGTSSSPAGAQKMAEKIGMEDFWVLKLNAMGAVEWEKTLGGTGPDRLTGIRQTDDGGYIVGGTSASEPSGEKHSQSYGNTDYWAVKLKASGTVEWEQTYGGRYADVLESIEPTSDGGYILGGWSNSPLSGNKNEKSFGEGDYWILKLDQYGTVEWQRTLGGEGDDHLYALMQTKDGGYMAAGNSRSGATGRKAQSSSGTDFWLLKLDERGEIKWQEVYDFGKRDILSALVENPDGSFLVGGHAHTETTGLKRSDKKGINDYVALKIDAEGEEKWRKSVGSKGADMLRAVAETRDGGYLLAGTSRGAASRDKNSGRGRADFWVVKLLDEDKKEEGRYMGLEAIPNPAGDFTNVIVDHEFEEGTASVYDINGRQLQHFPIAHRTIPIDLGGLAIGVYIVKITTDGGTESVKVLKGD